MSDFDREAERERLREKYEKDKEKRESTQRMSELLLKGATMTNQHCDECGSPIFRHDGQEFCPTCRGTDEAPAGETPAPAEEANATTNADADAGGAESRTPATGGASSAADRDAESVRGPGSETDAPQANDAAGTAAGPAEAETPTAHESDAEVSTPAETTAAGATDRNAATDPEHTAGTGAPRVEGGRRVRQDPEAGADANPSPGANAGGADETTAAAREALLRALRTHADRAADEADPRRASDHLAAAREAAEALSALDRR